MIERTSRALRQIIKGLLAPIDYYAMYPATVIKDHGDMTLDVEPDSEKLPQMTRLPLLGILPNCRVKVKKGARVFVGFENGEPTKPRCYVFDSGVLELLELRTGLGHTIIMEDDRGQRSGDDVYAKPHLQIKSKSGHQLMLWDKAGQEKIELKDKVGQVITMDSIAQKISVKANVQINLDAPLVTVGNIPVARVGDLAVGGVVAKNPVL